MDKIFGFFTKKRRKKSFPHTPLDVLATQVYRNYEFDSENSLVRYSDAFLFDFEKKLNCGLNLSENDFKSHLVDSNLKNTSSDVRTSNKHTSFEKVDKSAKSMLVINIRNGKYFHIGPQETVNVMGSCKPVGEGLSMSVDLDFLLDCHQKISEEGIMVISLHMGDNWKKFGTSLGLKENYLEEVKSRNDENAVFITFDILQKYIGLFPKTSVGFIVSILYEIKQIKIIKEIEKRKLFM